MCSGWGSGALEAWAAQPLVNGPSSNAFSSWTTADFAWLRQGEAAVPTVCSNTILAMLRMLFFSSSLQDLKLSVGQLEARVYTRLCRVASLQSAEILFPGALRIPPGLPTPTPPTPANGHVSVSAEDEKQAILNVPLSRSFHCASWWIHASQFPATVPRSVSRGFCTFDPYAFPLPPEGTWTGTAARF